MNTSFNTLDVSLIVIGIASAAMLLFLMRRMTGGKAFMLIPFVIAAIVAYVVALGGGLIFGILGVVVAGLVPFAIALPLGYWIIMRFTTSPAIVPTEIL
jgi:hypothetical protein